MATKPIHTTIVYIDAHAIWYAIKTHRRMNKTKFNVRYVSRTVVKILKRYNIDSQKKHDRRLAVAAQLNEAMNAKGWTHRDLAMAVGKRPGEVRKWLDGTNNVTSDVLSKLEKVLDLQL